MRTLRTGLSQPPGSDLTPLVPLIRQTLAFIDRGSVNDPATAADASELAFLLAALLEAGDEDFGRQAFGLLFRLGVEGEVLSVIHLEKKPEDQALGLLNCLEDEEKLLFVNAHFRRPRPGRPKTAAWGMAVVADVVERNPDELLILLDLLANRHEYPALPLRNALVRGRLGMWLARLLQMDLSAEQTRYMARVIGRLREPSLVEKLALRLGDMDELSAEAVCHALAETPGLDAATVAGPVEALLAGSESSLATAALAALARCDPAKAAAPLAARLSGRPDSLPELLPSLTGFSLAAFGQCLRDLPPAPRRQALLAAYAHLAAAVPGEFQTAARAVCAASAWPGEVLRTFTADLAVRGRAASRPLPPRAPLSGPEPPREGGKGLWQRVKTLVAAPGGSGEDGEHSAALRRELAQGGELHRRQILWTSLDGETVANVTFRQCTFKGVGFAKAVLADVVFAGCQFSDVVFDEASLSRIDFTGCRFLHCRFSRAALDTVRLTDCELRLCAFETATGQDMALTSVDVAECDFYSAFLARLTLDQCRFQAVSLVRADIHGLTARGVLFSDCLFEMAAFPGADLGGTRTEGCYFAGSRFSGVTEEPDILGAMFKDEAAALNAPAEGPPLPQALSDGPGLRLVAASCDAFLFSRDIRRRRLSLLANNKRRLAWARWRLGESGAALLDMLPGLIAADMVRGEAGPRPAPAADIAGYHPDLQTLRHLSRHFGKGVQFGHDAPRTDAVRVEAVYTIGSVGTVAQTADSDLDVWVCVGDNAPARPDFGKFQRKLETISAFADRELGLEVHFFCMTGKDIRDNVFGYSEDEGYGSAQGCLLKEEFYRTALVVAGKKPVWWCVPPRAGREAYDKALAGISRAEPEIAADSLDFGCVSEIAADEYFGASLWMIVKSLTSPFKSIIKFGLLEKYAENPDEPSLLCETLKESVFANQGGLWRCDPYALLFREVSRHHQERGRTGAVELLRQAFLQKTGFDPCDEYVGRSGETILDHFFPYAPPAAGACPPPPKRRPADEQDGFAAAVALGDAVTSYFLRAYERLKARGATLESGGGLTERDQTMLSRRIAASFSRRVGKIMRMPFIRPGRNLFATLEIGFEEQKTRETAFVAHGEPAGGDRKARKKELLRQDSSIVRLAAWLCANELYRPGLHIQAQTLPAPLTLPDVTGLLNAVHAQFPVRETFAPPLSQGLAPERVTAALVIVNLLAPREERRTVAVDVLYATSWGEFFHLARAEDLAALEESPSCFLAGCVGIGLDPHLRLEVYAPAKSQCLTARQARRSCGAP